MLKLTKVDKIMFLEGVVALFFSVLILVFVDFSPLATTNTSIEETTKAFKNSEVLVCHNTLIVSDSNWKLVDNHLINNNSAGYILIDNCKIKKD